MVKRNRFDSRRLFDEPSLGDKIERAFRSTDPNRGTVRLVYDPPNSQMRLASARFIAAKFQYKHKYARPTRALTFVTSLTILRVVVN